MKSEDINNEKNLKPVVLYGAGNNAKLAYKRVRSIGMIPICFADSDINKHTNGLPSCHYFDLPVMSIEYILNIYPNCDIYITPNSPIKFEIIDMLIEIHHVAKERIINYEPYVKRIVCEALLNTIVLEKEHISTCCHVDIAEKQTTKTPCFDFKALTNEQMLDSFIKLRKEAIESLKNGGEVCKGCHEARLIYSSTYFDKKRAKINTVAFGTGFVCQINCIYCTHNQQPLHERIINTDKMLSFWEYLKSRDIVTDDVVVFIANGEITINPRFDNIMETFSHNVCVFASNGLIFQDKIAEKLLDGVSTLNVSLDSGTAETYRRVKGVDAFDTVCKNIKKYSQYGNILLKYILIPDLNDGVTDIDHFIEFAKDVNAIVCLSRDFYGARDFDMNIDSVINAVTFFMKRAKQAGVIVQIDETYKIGQYKDRLCEVLNYK